ncbi:MAG: hypothetical protein ACTSRP_11940 [Candidatus Helarchaeota archaeon]
MSELNDLILDLITLGFLLPSIILGFIIGFKSYGTYKKNKNFQNEIFTIMAFSLSIAVILLISEQIFLTLVVNIQLGLFFGAVATITSGIVVVTTDAFAFSMVFTKKYKILTIISTIFMSMPVLLHIFDPTKTVEEGEIVFYWDPLQIGLPITPLVMFCVIIPLLIIPVLTFYYYSIKIRNKSKVRSKRALVLGTGILLISLAYIFELIGLPVIVVFLRSMFLMGGILIYYAMFKIKE